MKKKIALITGITGQDGSYLAELLLKKGYIVHGLIRRSSLIKTDRIDHIFNNPRIGNKKLFLHYGDLTDDISLFQIISKCKPNEIYNLAAQSHVKVSFEIPLYTANTDAIGTLRILETVKILQLKCKIYQASTSELYGDSKAKIMNEKTPFQPVSPYAVAKLYSFEIIKAYRKAYGIFASNGILFNHESPRRGETFVTKKIVDACVNFKKNKRSFSLGNLDSIRDWGHAKEYVEGMWKILQYKKADDFVLATGKTYSVKQFLEKCLKKLKIKFYVKKNKKKTIYFEEKTNKQICSTDKKYLRPNEVSYLKGDASKAKKILKWIPKISFDELVAEMINEKLSEI
jgi:GDPmannose 4,6-dehydratase